MSSSTSQNEDLGNILDFRGNLLRYPRLSPVPFFITARRDDLRKNSLVREDGYSRSDRVLRGSPFIPGCPAVRILTRAHKVNDRDLDSLCRSFSLLPR